MLLLTKLRRKQKILLEGTEVSLETVEMYIIHHIGVPSPKGV